MKRMHLKKRKKHNRINKVILIIIFLLIIIIHILNIFNKKALPLFLEYSEQETKSLATLVINNAVSKQITSNFSKDELFIISKDNNGNINSIDFNSSVINNILSATTKNVELNLKYLKQGKVELLDLDDMFSNYNLKKLKKGIIYELPSGIIFNNSLVTNIFPKIPVKLDFIGSIVSKINTNISSYGINNALVEVYLDLEVSIKVILPFASKSSKVMTSVPIAIKIIEGNIPTYYLNGYLNNPSLTNSID